MRFKNVKNRINAALISGIILSLFAFTACGSDDDGGNGKTFKAYNMETDTVYSVTAKLVYEGTYCKVYRENGSESYMNDATATAMGQEFDSNIYSKINDNFGAPSDVDGDGKITLLVLDILDGFSGSGGYVAGYFDSTNEYDTASAPDSNETDMLYMDSYPGATDQDGFKQTMAHEFQHLVNFNQKVFVQRSSTGFDTWINEGMSSAAEKIYNGAQVQWKIDYYNEDENTFIAQGQNFVAWGNDTYSSDLGNYATVYLFFQWLGIQAGGDTIYKAIMDNDYDDYNAVYDEVAPNLTGFAGSSFGDLLRDWFIANLLNNTTGLYGYKGNITLITVNYLDDLSIYPATGVSSYPLLPGEGVYVHISGSHAVASSYPVYYSGITTSGGAIDAVSPYIGNVLLCYNINGNPGGSSNDTGALPNVLPGSISKILKSVSAVNRIYPIDVVFNHEGKPSLKTDKLANKNSEKLLGKKLN